MLSIINVRYMKTNTFDHKTWFFKVTVKFNILTHFFVRKFANTPAQISLAITGFLRTFFININYFSPKLAFLKRKLLFFEELFFRQIKASPFSPGYFLCNCCSKKWSTTFENHTSLHQGYIKVFVLTSFSISFLIQVKIGIKLGYGWAPMKMWKLVSRKLCDSTVFFD